MTIEEIEAAFMDLVHWKQQELARRAAPPASAVSSLDGYIGLWRLRNDLTTMLKGMSDLTERLELQQSIITVDQEIAAAKADPRLAPQITTWWLSRYPNGGKR